MKKTEGYKHWLEEKELIEEEGIYPTEEKQYTHRDMECVREFEQVDDSFWYIIMLIVWVSGVCLGFFYH